MSDSPDQPQQVIPLRSDGLDHYPILHLAVGPKHEDYPAIPGYDWDGTSRIGCQCGWFDARLWAPGVDLGRLAEVWRDHLTAATYGLPERDRRA
jgi:hypothetical protein